MKKSYSLIAIIIILLFLYWASIKVFEELDAQARKDVLNYAKIIGALPGNEKIKLNSLDELKLEREKIFHIIPPLEINLSQINDKKELYYCSVPLGPCEVLDIKSGEWHYEEI